MNHPSDIVWTTDASGRPRAVVGTWPVACPQRAFVDGVAWAMAELAVKGTLFPSERDEAEAEAIRRYGLPDDPKSPQT